MNAQELQAAHDLSYKALLAGDGEYTDTIDSLLKEVYRLTAELDTVAAANARLAAERDALAGQLAQATQREEALQEMIADYIRAESTADANARYDAIYYP